MTVGSLVIQYCGKVLVACTCVDPAAAALLTNTLASSRRMAAGEGPMSGISGVDAFLDLSRSQQGPQPQPIQPLPAGDFIATACYAMQAGPALCNVSERDSPLHFHRIQHSYDLALKQVQHGSIPRPSVPLKLGQYPSTTGNASTSPLPPRVSGLTVIGFRNTQTRCLQGTEQHVAVMLCSARVAMLLFFCNQFHLNMVHAGLVQNVVHVPGHLHPPL